MTALSQARPVVQTEGRLYNPPVKGSTTIYQGGIVTMDNGLAVPGRTAAGLIALGIAQMTVVNSGADGAKKVPVERGTFKFANLGTDAVTAADIGKDCFIVDDQTVAKTSATNTRSIAGKVMEVDVDGVFVRIGA